MDYLLSPNPTIMEHACLNKNQGHNTAVEHLITKLILDQSLVGNERKAGKSELIDKFFDEYNNFVNKRNAFGRDHIWYFVKVDNLKAYRWHHKYMLPVTDILGHVACLVLSKILEIGTAKRNWKQVKKIKKGDRMNIGIGKCTNMVLVY